MPTVHPAPQQYDGATCSFCGEKPRKVGPVVEGRGVDGTGGIFICRECAELVLTIVAEEKRRAKGGPTDDHGEPPTVTVRRPTLTYLQKLVRESVIEHNGAMPKESALVWFGYFASLLAWELLSLEDFETLMKLLPDYPGDVVVQGILGRSSVTPGER